MEANKELTTGEIIEKYKSSEIRDSAFGSLGRYDLRTYEFIYVSLSAAEQAMEEYANQWKQKCDELKAENRLLESDIYKLKQDNSDLEAIVAKYVAVEDRQEAEHAALKTKAQRLVDASNVMCEYFDWLMKDPDFLAYRQLKEALSEWQKEGDKQTNNQNTTNGSK